MDIVSKQSQHRLNSSFANQVSKQVSSLNIETSTVRLSGQG